MLFSWPTHSGAMLGYVHRSSSFGNGWPFLVAFVSIVFFWFVLLWWDRRKNVSYRKRKKKRAVVFDELVEAHRLSATERARLEALAKLNELDHPAKLFVDYRFLQEAAQMPELEEELRTDYAQLLEKLFGELPQQEPFSDSPPQTDSSSSDTEELSSDQAQTLQENISPTWSAEQSEPEQEPMQAQQK